MTKEMQELIDRELDAALEAGDAKLVDRALINSQRLGRLPAISRRGAWRPG